MTDLSWVQAQRRAAQLAVDSYRLDFDLTAGGDVLGSRSTITFACREPGTSTFVELESVRTTRIELNGTVLDPAGHVDGRITLPGLRADNVLIVEAEVAYSRTGEGAHRFTDPADGQTYVGAYLGVDVAHQLFACFDQPDLKGTLSATVSCPPGWTIVGNTPAREITPGRWELPATVALSPYLFAFVAGPLHTIAAEHAGRHFTLHCRSSLAEHLDRDADELFAITHACYDRYSELFDEPYPYDSYGQAFVPGLNWGALESPGCVLFRDELVFRSAVTATERQSRATIIAHEMAHMWFGDLVTMRWWNDLWLSESFAEYMGCQVIGEATAYTGVWTDFAVARKTWGYDADQRPSTHPVAPPDAVVAYTGSALSNFDGISYAKGASALRQLVAWLGREEFLRGVNTFIARHRFGCADRDDLFDALTEASGRDVSGWAQAWLQTSGVDTLRVERGPDAIAVIRAGSRPHRVDVGMYAQTDGRLERYDTAGLDVDADRTDIGDARRSPALVLLNDGDLTYCKARLDATSWAAVSAGLGSIADPLSRGVLWTTARDLVRDGELATSAYLDLVARHLPHETDPALVRGSLQFARYEIADHYLADGRVAALEAITEVCRTLIGAASDDLELTALRVLVDCAATPAEIAGWLSAGASVGGRPLDADLRWRIMVRLAVLAAAGPAEIDAELARDPSALGHEHAIACRAALPDAGRKQDAWASIFGGDALSARELTAAGQGFWWPEQTALLAGYVDRFFGSAATLARRRGQAVAKVLTGAAFPHHAVDAATLAAGRGSLDADDPTPTLRRGLVDRLDDLERALRVRAVAGAA